MSLPIIEQAKIQAQVLVPLVKALQGELGERQANALVRRALGDIYWRYGEEFWRNKREKSVGNVMASAFATFARGDALDYQVREQSQDVFAIESRDAGTPSSTGSWANRSSGFSWSAAQTF